MEGLIVTSIFYFLLAWIAIAELNKRKEDILNITAFKEQKKTLPFIALIPFLFSILFYTIVFGILDVKSNRNDGEMGELFQENTILYFLFLCIMAPIAEELFFRRFLFARISKKRGLVIGYLVSLFPFALIHISPPNIIHALFLGSFFTYLFYRTNSIIPAIIAHAINNLIPIFAPMLKEKIVFIYFFEFDSPWRHIEFILAIILLIFSVRKIHQLTRKVQEDNAVVVSDTS
jgi:membrane protease YdiL (CAAX protease family)